MKVYAKSGSFASPTATGNQSITGLGFKPKAVIFFMNKTTTDASVDEIQVGMGFATSSAQRFYVASELDDNVAAGDSNRRVDNAKCIGIVNNAATVVRSADFVSMDSDGFTINWTTANATQHRVNYIALGGLIGAKVGTFNTTTTTGSKAIAGVGFRPDLVFVLYGLDSTTLPGTNSTQSRWTFGFANFLKQVGFFTQGSDTLTPQATRRDQNTSNFYKILQNSGTNLEVATFTSMDSDGFTFNIGTASGVNKTFGYLAIQGVQSKVGTITQPSTTGNQTVTGCDTNPEMILFIAYGDITNSPGGRFYEPCIGVAIDSSDRRCQSNCANDGVNPTQTTSDSDTTKCIKNETANAGAPTVDSAADFVSKKFGEFVVNWTTADATAREIVYLAIGSPNIRSRLRKEDNVLRPAPFKPGFAVRKNSVLAS